MQDGLGNHFYIRAGLVVMQEEQIDIGIRVQLRASVPTTSDYSDSLVETRKPAVMIRVGMEIERPHQDIDVVRESAHDFESAGTGQMTLEKLLPRRLDVLARQISVANATLQLLQQPTFFWRLRNHT